MGIFRGGLVAIFAVLLFVSAFFGSVFLTMSSSLSYDDVSEQTYPAIYDLINDSQTNQDLFYEINPLSFKLGDAVRGASIAMQSHCLNYQDYVFVFEEYTIALSCSSLVDDQTLFEEASQRFVDNMYYKEYDCEFWNCFRKAGLPFFLISEKAQDYFEGRFYFSLLVFLALSVLVFIFIEQRQNTPIIGGGIMVISSILLSRLGNFIENSADKTFTLFIKILFDNSNTIFWWILILGSILVLVGIGFRIWQADLIKKKFSREDVKKMVKDEMKKKNLKDKIPKK